VTLPSNVRVFGHPPRLSRSRKPLNCPFQGIARSRPSSLFPLTDLTLFPPFLPVFSFRALLSHTHILPYVRWSPASPLGSRIRGHPSVLSPLLSFPTNQAVTRPLLSYLPPGCRPILTFPKGSAEALPWVTRSVISNRLFSAAHIPLFANHIRALTGSFNSKLLTRGSPSMALVPNEGWRSHG
jgi:hypothetical protein